MVCINKGKTSVGTYSKLQERKLGPFKICHKVGNNAYVLELLDHLHISPTFNIADIYPYYPPKNEISSMEDSGESSIPKEDN